METLDGVVYPAVELRLYHFHLHLIMLKTRVGQITERYMTEKLINECGKDDLSPHEVQKLSFSFKHISKIANLTGFSNLRELILDNNQIERIENLSCLPMLRRLDLSFNRIRVIEGLDQLTLLDDLSLYANEIETLLLPDESKLITSSQATERVQVPSNAPSGLDPLQNLTCLSLGRNKLTELEVSARVLRRLPKLRLVTLAGNPLASRPDYRTKILGFCNPIRYLDGELVDPSEVQRAQSSCNEELLDIIEQERRAVSEAASAVRQAQERHWFSTLGLDGLDTLFEEFWTDDADGRTLRQFAEQPEFAVVRDLFDRYSSRVAEAIDDLAKRLANLQEKKKAEVIAYNAGLSYLKDKAVAQSTFLIKQFEKLRKDLEMRVGQDMSPARIVEILRDDAEKLRNELISIEINLSEGAETLRLELDHQHRELTDRASEAIAAGFSRLREEEKSFQNGPTHLTNHITADLVAALSRLSDQRHGEIRRDLHTTDTDVREFSPSREDTQQLLIDSRDEVAKLAHEAHETRMQKLYAKEEAAVSAESSKHEQLIQELAKRDRERNRMRICEINLYYSLVLQDIESILES